MTFVFFLDRHRCWDEKGVWDTEKGMGTAIFQVISLYLLLHLFSKNLCWGKQNTAWDLARFSGKPFHSSRSFFDMFVYKVMRRGHSRQVTFTLIQIQNFVSEQKNSDPTVNPWKRTAKTALVLNMWVNLFAAILFWRNLVGWSRSARKFNPTKIERGADGTSQAYFRLSHYGMREAVIFLCFILNQ